MARAYRAVTDVEVKDAVVAYLETRGGYAREQDVSSHLWHTHLGMYSRHTVPGRVRRCVRQFPELFTRKKIGGITMVVLT